MVPLDQDDPIDEVTVGVLNSWQFHGRAWNIYFIYTAF
jgi:hypothetical protein